MLRVGLFAIMMLTANVANANYLCVSEAATGFNYNEQTKRWEITKFTSDKNICYRTRTASGRGRFSVRATCSGGAAALSGITFTVAMSPK
jgi:hypothetical protein